ncbi:hypothetical protein SxD43FB_19550 [Sphingobium sp. D43FB]|nr:hypothetical protein SxD43FB_19550 [Sphingobium sp. D43FB]
MHLRNPPGAISQQSRAQASYLATLCEEAGVELPTGDLTKADASRQIDEMKAKLGRA